MGLPMQWKFLEVLSPSRSLSSHRAAEDGGTATVRMKLWAKKTEQDSGACRVAQAALAGASREELLREALNSLTREERLDRAGIWLEPDASAESGKELSGAFRGLAWDRALPDPPPEWRNLSVEPPLPNELWTAGKTVEQEFAPSSGEAVIGQLVGLRRALWIPVATRNQVKGLILLGSSGKPLAGCRERAESVAAQLALALELKDQLQFNRARKADLALVRRFLESSPDASSSEALLSKLAAACVRQAVEGEGPGAAFAMIGVLQGFAESSGAPSQVDFRWRSGDEAWVRAMEKEPLATVWRRAVDTRQVIGSDPPVTWPQPSVARIVALPLEAQGQLLGVLVAGLPGGAASLATLDRMELRARLAAAALLGRKLREQESQRALSQQELLDLVSDPVLLLDDSGKVLASTRGARNLLQRPGQAAGPLSPSPSSSSCFSDLFIEHERIRLRKWFQQPLDWSTSGNTGDKGTPQVELQNGLSVRLRLAPRVPGQPAAVLLQPLSAGESGRQPDQAEAELHNVLEWLEEGVVLFDSRENVRAMNTRFEQIAGLSPEESGKIKTLEALIARLAEQAAEPTQFAERWRALARDIESGVREELQMVRPAPRILEAPHGLCSMPSGVNWAV